MIVVGIIMQYLPPFMWKWFIILIAWNTKWIRNSLGKLLKGKQCLIYLILYISNWVCLYIYRTCSLALARLNLGPPVISCINSRSSANSPSTCMVVIRKPHFKSYIYNSLKDLNIVMNFLSDWFITAVKIILRLRKIKTVFHLQRIFLLS